MVGDGFGGRGWYVPHNYQVGAYSAYTVCGTDSQLYGWGGNNSGELGDGTNISTNTPVAALNMKNVKFYSTGYTSVVIKNDNTAWVWGNFAAFSTSTFSSGFTYTPALVTNNVKFADGGISHAVFVKQDGTVVAVGQNQNGELGNGSTSTIPITNPVTMVGISNAVRAVAVGYDYAPIGYAAASVILLADGTVKITGGGNWFQATNSTVPVTVNGLANVIDIKGNATTCYALTANGDVYSFGRQMQLGSVFIPSLGTGVTDGSLHQPAKIDFPAGAGKIVALSSNNDGYHCFALDSSHNLFAWGYNVYGQLGCGDTIDRATPIFVASNVLDIFAGENFSYILKADSTLWSTGSSGYPQVPEYDYGSIWMNLPNIKRSTFTQISPTIAPMNLCAPKVWGVVPVKLSNFSCVANGNTAYLNWQSAEETNASKYIVQYSNDGSSFKDIATVFATGSNSKYNYTHQQVSGTAFYRLKMMDKDGSFSYSEIRVVKFDNKSGFTIAPNPANDVVYIFTKNSNVIKSIQIISVDGQLVKVLNAYNAGQRISISNLSKGVYILKAVYQNNEMEYGRFIKM